MALVVLVLVVEIAPLHVTEDVRLIVMEDAIPLAEQHAKNTVHKRAEVTAIVQVIR